MTDILQRAGEKYDFSPEDVLTHTVRGAELHVVVNRGIAGCPKYRIPLADLEAPEPEPEDELDALDYRELQGIAKQHGIPANQSGDDLAAAIRAELIDEEE